MANKSRLTSGEVEDLVWMIEGVEFAQASEVPSKGGFDPFIHLVVQIGNKEHEFELHDSITPKELLTLFEVITGSRKKARNNIERFEIENW